jgi:hypothetical protein
MSNAIQAVSQQKAGEIIEAVIARGDIAQLNPEERAKYYVKVCESVGLNPMTRPFEYITLNGKLTLYARKDCTDQLRAIHKVSVTDLIESEREGVFVVTAKVVNGEGRTDASKGAVPIQGLKGDALANALMKAETKAKRRATLSICGLGFLDESEIETIPGAAPANTANITTLPKKDAKPTYEKLQREIDALADFEQAKQWGNDAAARVGVLPPDWQDILRLRLQEKIVELRQLGTKNPAPQPTQAEMAPSEGLRSSEEDTLRRGSPDPEADPAAFITYATGKLNAATSHDHLCAVWNEVIEPAEPKLFPPDQEELMGVFRAKEREFE